MTTPIFAIGLGLGTKSKAGNWLEVYYAKLFQEHAGNTAAIADFIDIIKTHCGYTGANQVLALAHCDLPALLKKFQDTHHASSAAFCAQVLESGAQDRALITVLTSDTAIDSTPAAYLKLQLLSQRMIKPQSTNLTGIFSVLPNVAWTNQGAIAIEELAERQLQARLAGQVLSVDSVDKFPKMTDYVVPSGVRIADAARVRLGAYLGEGTTVMHEGFCNFNAGTEGTNMIEGRISAGVFVREGSDLGGGCSTMGTLSGGNDIVIGIGKACLIGANAGVNIPLGDRCTIEAGLYLTAGSKVTVIDKQGSSKKMKAFDLANVPDLLFRRNSQNGCIEVLSNHSIIELNNELHSNN